MCGIVGIAGFEDRELVREMTASLSHRGPDGEGFLFDPEVSLGHRRLAIIDLSGGAQPMSTSDGRAWVSFNGQIYNYRDLMKELESEYSFRTHCDTEVLPVLYSKFGQEMVHRLRGMFAFAVWDRTDKTLFLARDRIGIKPLYYAVLGSRLLFASEPKAILRCAEVSREIDPVALDAYLSLLYVPPPYSIYRGIRQLPPAHTLTWRAGEVEVRKYWDAEPRPDFSRTDEEWAEEIAPILEDSIRMRMMSDVPLGAFLSGGIDSSTIVSVLAREGSKPVETFCIGFGEEGRAYEERPIARRVAGFFNTNHHEMEITLDLLSGLEGMVRAFDEPFGNPTAMLTSELSRFTRQFVTVSLAGDGGDEMFGGYPRYQGMAWSEKLRSIPGPLRRLMASWVGGRESSTARNYRRWARQLLEGCDYPAAERYSRWVGYRGPEERDRLLSPALREEVRKAGRIEPVIELFNAPSRGGGVERSVYSDLHGFLPENVLRYSDRMSMAHSLEARVPLTDHVLVEAMMRIPARRQVGLLASKRLLRKVMKGKLPEEVLARKKLGFNPPMGVWLQEDSRKLLSEWLHPDVLRRRGLLEASEVNRLVEEHRTRRRDHGLPLWSLVVLEAWMRLYLDSR
ncbi:MAG: Asparagine synthetase [glutamine-hydrolyzing] 1 [bacterium]|nr:Asparagine synthetase [glutamine-hydrolyzing] 1 [bacterium]